MLTLKALATTHTMSHARNAPSWKTFLSTLESGCSDVQSSEECKADFLHALKQAKENIMSWKAHQLRSVHQTEAKHCVLEKLDSRSVLLVQDWALK